jgi:hypothetical protein
MRLLGWAMAASLQMHKQETLCSLGFHSQQVIGSGQFVIYCPSSHLFAVSSLFTVSDRELPNAI